MASTGPTYASAGSNNNSYGTTAWSNPGNVTADDNTYAVATSVAPGGISQYLVATCPNPSIPVGATIDGLVVGVGKTKSGLTNFVDDRVRLVLSGTVQSNDKASGTAWPTTETLVTYGGAADLWGGTVPGVADFNAGNVGVAIAVRNSGASNPGNASIDYVQFTIYYTAAGVTASVNAYYLVL